MDYSVIDPYQWLEMSEADCAAILFRARWPEGFRCPRCSAAKYSVIRTRRLPLYECAVCRRQCSVISGTVMERSRTPLPKWFAALALMVRYQVSAARLSWMIGVTYKTAWLMMHKLRDIMANITDNDPLTGLVRLERGMINKRVLPHWDGLYNTERPFIIGASMDEEGRPLRINIQLDQGGDTYHYKITPQGARRFIHQRVDLTAARIDLTTDDFGRTNVPALRQISCRVEAEIAWSHRTVGAKHSHYYLQEQVYRFNVEQSGEDLLSAFIRLAGSSGAPDRRAVVSRPVPPRPDWTTRRDVFRMKREMKALAAELMLDTRTA